MLGADSNVVTANVCGIVWGFFAASDIFARCSSIAFWVIGGTAPDAFSIISAGESTAVAKPDRSNGTMSEPAMRGVSGSVNLCPGRKPVMI